MATNNFSLDFVDHSTEIIAQFNQCCHRALEEIGLRCEGYAAALCPVGTVESTNVQHYSGGTLRQSLTHKVVGNEVFVGSNVYYAVYVEHGTGIYADNGKGRQSPWVWRDKNGDYHWTRGIKPQHFLLKAITEHDNEYLNVIKNAFVF